MMTTKQKWLLGALFPLCAAIWFPQVAARFGGGETAAALGPEDEAILSSVASGEVVSTMPAGVDPNALPSDGVLTTNPGGASLPGATNFSLVSPEATLAAVLSTLQEADAFGGSRRTNDLGRIQDAPLEDVEPNFTSPMVDFIGRHPLRGTISGEATKVAVFGDHRVRLGEELPGTSAKVVAVSRGAVTLEEGPITLEVDLPPLRTSTLRMQARGGALDTADAQSGRFQEVLDTSNEPVSAGLVGGTTSGGLR